MRSMKKIVALLMVAMMLCAFTAIASAEEVDYTDAAQRLSTINIMKGDTSGNLMLDSGVTRYQAALFFVQALTGETAVEKWNEDKNLWSVKSSRRSLIGISAWRSTPAV